MPKLAIVATAACLLAVGACTYNTPPPSAPTPATTIITPPSPMSPGTTVVVPAHP